MGWIQIRAPDLGPNCLARKELMPHYRCSKTCLKQPLSKRQKNGFQDQLSLNASQQYCRMLQGEHSAILLTFIKLLFAFKIFVLSIFEWPLKTGFTVHVHSRRQLSMYNFQGEKLRSYFDRYKTFISILIL